MHISDDMTKKLCRHAPRERVSWNPNPIQKAGLLNCHAPRERVSWNLCNEIVNSSCNVTLHVSVWVEITFSGEGSIIRVRSHAPRERVSWNGFYSLCNFLVMRHAPRERVSWNPRIGLAITNSVVTLHVSVWVEIDKSYLYFFAVIVTLHVSVWVEIVLYISKRLTTLVTLHVSVWVEIHTA